METLKVGPLNVTFHRTVRVKEGQISDLPPSLGRMPFYLVKEFQATCPDSWDENAVFVPLHENEALWLDFKNSGTPLAALVGAGGINALTGEKLGLTLEKENYMTVPPQPWIDGWKGEDGTVYQFVCTEHKQGEGKTVAEQLIGKESKTGGLGIAVFEAKNPRELEKFSRPEEVYFKSASPSFYGNLECCGLEYCKTSSGECDDGVDYCCDEEPIACAAIPEPVEYSKSISRGARGQSANRVLRKKAMEMGVGKGGKIFQKIYPDPYGIETWKTEPSAAVAVYLVGAVQFSEITGQPMPPMPKSAQDYIGAWYGLKDEGHKDISGSDKFTGLESVFNQATEGLPVYCDAEFAKKD